MFSSFTPELAKRSIKFHPDRTRMPYQGTIENKIWIPFPHCLNVHMKLRPRRRGYTCLIPVALALAGCGSSTPFVETPQESTCQSTATGADEASGTALLALSGGGYRAALYHLGALWRLNDAGKLPTLGRVSSVSGGSITASVLAANWNRLAFNHNRVAECFEKVVVEPLLRFTDHTIDIPSVLTGALPLTSAGARLEHQYTRLLGHFTLDKLPKSPDFIFNATNLQTGAIWRFSRRYMGDRSIGIICAPNNVSVAQAVAASSAFPPILSPVTLRLRKRAWINPDEQKCPGWLTPTIFAGMYAQAASVPHERLAEFQERVVLVDGGVADNLGVESLWGHEGPIYFSDGGSGLDPAEKPALNWLSQSLRVVALIHNQPSQLRANFLVERKAISWSIQSPDPAYALSEPESTRLAELPTRMKALDSCTKRRLINAGYLAADSALRKASPALNASEPNLPFKTVDGHC
jgi:NTE family protein